MGTDRQIDLYDSLGAETGYCSIERPDISGEKEGQAQDAAYGCGGEQTEAQDVGGYDLCGFLENGMHRYHGDDRQGLLPHIHLPEQIGSIVQGYGGFPAVQRMTEESTGTEE